MGRLSGLKSWGSAGWRFLHAASWTYASNPTPEDREEMFTFLHAFSSVIPCNRCKKHWQVFLSENLSDVHSEHLKSRTSLTKFLVYGHNQVNLRLGKPYFSYESARELYDPAIPTKAVRMSFSYEFAFVVSIFAIVAVIVVVFTRYRSASARVRNRYRTFQHRVDNVRLRVFPLLTSS